MSNATYSFIVRIWQEGSDHAGNITAWRGSIDDVAMGERQHFCELEGIGLYIQERLGLPGRGAPSPCDNEAPGERA